MFFCRKNILVSNGGEINSQQRKPLSVKQVHLEGCNWQENVYVFFV